MAAAQPSTTEMEDEESIEGVLNCGGGGGGGEKRKRKGQEEDPDSIQIGSRGRVGMLGSIEGVLKCINSVVCFPQLPAADCCEGLRRETVTLEEHMIAGLIYSHVCTYIILYHLEKKRTVDNSCRIKDIVTLAGDGHVLTDWECVDDTLCGVELQLSNSICPLIRCWRSLVDHPTPQQPSVDRGTTQIAHVSSRLRDHALGLHKQELLDVLHTLEVIGLARGHAPPEDGKEILFYKQIRKQISSFLVHAHVRDSVRNPTNCHALFDPFIQVDGSMALCLAPPTLELEVALDHMPDHHDILKEFMQRVTQHLSRPTPLPDRFLDLFHIMCAKDASRSALLTWMPMQGSSVTTRSACLDRIIAISGRIKPFGEQTPTESEVRMYALLGEHVRSSIWLCASRPQTDTGKVSCKVYLANASTAGDHSSLSKPDAHGERDCTREQLLEQMMPYLRALKSSCMDDVPTSEEWKKYHAIWAWLLPGLLVCMCSRPMPHVDAEAGQASELERKVSFIYNKVLSSLAALKEGILSLAAAVHHAILPGQHLSPQDALDWLVKCGDDAATKVKEFVDRSMSDGTMAHLDHAIVMLAELAFSGTFFIRLSDAVNCVDVKNVDNVKTVVASEVQNALDFICSEQPRVK